MAADGLVSIESAHGAKETMERLEAGVKAKGLTVFARIDHAEGAAQVGLPLRPTAVLIFGNARGGTRLMQADQTVGIDLPLNGGYSLMQLINKGNVLTPFQVNWFRAGHAHAGVLLLMSLLYYTFIETTAYSLVVKHAACATLVVGILAQSGGFFVHMMVGQPNQASIGNTITKIGAALLVLAVVVLIYGLITAP
jgi:hypothetical protein